MPTELAVLKVYPRGIQDLSEPNLGYETQVPPLEFPDGKPPEDGLMSAETIAANLDWDHGVPPGTEINRVEPTGFVEPSPWEKLYVEWVAADLDAELSADWCDSDAPSAPEYTSLLNRLDKSEPFDSPGDVDMPGLTIQRAETRRGEARAVARQIRRWKRQNPGEQLAGVRILAPMELIELWRRELQRYDLPVTSFSAKPVIRNGLGRWIVNLSRLGTWSSQTLRRSDLRAIFESDYWSAKTYVEHLDRDPRETSLRLALRIGVRTLRRDMLTLDDWRQHITAKKHQAEQKGNDKLAAGFEVAIELAEELVKYLRRNQRARKQLAGLQTLLDKDDKAIDLGIDPSLKRYEEDSNELTDALQLVQRCLTDWIRESSQHGDGSERLQRFLDGEGYGLPTFLRDALSEQRQSDNQLREDGVQLYDYETAKRFLCKPREAEGPLFLTGLGEGFIPTVPDKPTQRELAWLEAYGIIDDAEARDAAGNYALEEIERQITRLERYIAEQRGRLVLSWFTEGEGTERVYPGPFLSQLIGGWSDVDWQNVESNPRVNDIRWADELPDSPADANAWFEASLFGEQLAGQQWSPSSPEASERYEQLCQSTEDLKASHAAESARSGCDGYYKPSEFTGFIGGNSGRDGPFSPTAMEDYGQCGTKYFLGRVIDLDETSDEHAEPDPLEIGNRIHLAMEAFGEDLLDEDKLQPLTSTLASGEERETPLVDEVRAKLEEQFDSFSESEWTGSEGLMNAISEQWIEAGSEWISGHLQKYIPADFRRAQKTADLELIDKRENQKKTIQLLEGLAEAANDGITSWDEAYDDPLPGVKATEITKLAPYKEFFRECQASSSPEKLAAKYSEEYRESLAETKKQIADKLAGSFNRHIYKTEYSYRQRDAGPAVIEINDECLELSGIVDRVDYDPDRDTYAVVDYKTGSKTGAKFSERKYAEAIEEGQAFQLMSYALAIEALKGAPGLEELEDASLVQVGFEFLKEGNAYRGRDSVNLTLPKDGDEAPTLEQLQEITKKWLRANAKNIREGKFPLLPSACPIVQYKGAYCDFEQTCRYNPAVKKTDPNTESPFDVPEFDEPESGAVEGDEKAEKIPEILEVDVAPEGLADEHEDAEKMIREKLDEDIVISAGAGTGKTHNLVVRYLQALSDGCSPSDILCITFTRKAAGEMTYRIRQALLSSDHSDNRMDELVEEIRQDTERNLSQLLAELSAAPIGTIDSLAGRIFTEHRELKGLSTDFDTVDDDDLRGELEEFIHRKFVDALDGIGNQDAVEAVQKLADEYPVGTLESYLKDVIVNDSLESKPDLSEPEVYVRDILTQFYADSIDNLYHQIVSFDWDTGRELFQQERDRRKPAAVEKLDEWFTQLDELRDAGKISQGVKLDLIKSIFELPNTKKELGEDGLYTWLKNKHKDVDWSVAPNFFKQYGKGNRDDNIEQLTEYFEQIYTIEKAWREELQEYLERQHRFRHRDVTRMVRNKVFKEANPNRTALAERFDFQHILVDEAQDTNQRQVDFIKKLRTLAEESVDKCPVFWVGDYKQSIYRFRAAQVDVFEKLQAETETTLTLTKNRRSTPDLLEAFNRFFGNLFPERNAGAERSIASMDYGPIISPDESSSAGDESIEIIGQTELEASDDDAFGSMADHALARRVKALSQQREASNYELNPEQGAEIAVLVTKWDDASNYRELFAQYGLRAAVQGGRGLLNCRETSAFIEWLKALLYPDRQIPVVSVLRAPPYSLSDTGLFCIAEGYGFSEGTPSDLRKRLTNPTIEFSPSDALSSWASSVDSTDVFERDRDELETILQQDAENLTRFKDTWSDVKQQLYRRSTADVFEDLIARENLKGFWNSRPNGQQRVANIEQFLDIVRDFEMRRGTEPFELLDELETKRDSSDPAAGGLAASRGADVVITTYWQAKGREWPVVVLPRIHKTSYEASYAGFGMTRIKPPESEEAAFLPELKIPDDHFETKDNKVLDELTKDLKNESARAEYKRLFYVAATRAEERLIMSGTFEPYPTSKTAKQRTWAEMLQYNINLRLDDEGIRLDEPSCWEDLDSIRLVRANEQKPPSPISSDEPKSEVDVFPERWAIYDSKPVEITGASLLDAVDSVPPPAEELSTPLPEAREESDEHATSSKPGQAFHYLMEQWGYRTDTIEDDLLKEALDAHHLLDGSEDERIERLRRLWQTICDADIVPALKTTAAQNNLWHEVPVRFWTDESEIISGEVDLLWRDSEGLHLLDYKSGTSYPTQEDDGKLSEHYPQVRMYADGIERLAGEPVVDYGLWYVRRDVRLRWSNE